MHIAKIHLYLYLYLFSFQLVNHVFIRFSFNSNNFYKYSCKYFLCKNEQILNVKKNKNGGMTFAHSCYDMLVGHYVTELI